MFRAAREGSALLSPPTIRLLRAAVGGARLRDVQFSLPLAASDCVAFSGHRRRFFSSLAEDSKVLPASSETPSQESMMYVLKKLGKSPQKAINFLDCARERYGFKPSGAVYNLMLGILGGSKECAKEFWIVAKRMREEGHCVDQGTYLTLLLSFKKQGMPADASSLIEFHSRSSEEAMADEGIRSAVEILSAAEEWTAAAGEEMAASKLLLSEENVSKLVREVREQPRKALGFFRWSEQRRGCKHGSTAYNSMARILGREDTIMEFWDLAEEMKKLGHEIDIDTYVKLSRRFLKNKMVKEAVQLYEQMMDGPYQPSPQDCGLLLRQISMTDQPDLDLVSRVVKKFESHGHSLSKSVYDGIHRSLTSVGSFLEAEQIMEKMKACGFDPDNITYSQLIYGLCKARKLDEARRIMAEMESSGCVPDLKTWTVLIQGHCAAGEVDGALTFFADMIAKGHKPDGHLLDDIVRGLCGHGRASAAHALVLEMLEKAEAKPWQATFKLLIVSLLRRRELEEAMKLLGKMKEIDFPPYGEPFAAYIAKNGTAEDAREFFKAMSRRSAPSPATYVKMFKAFFEEGRYEEARDLLFKCPHHVRKNSDVCKLFGSVKV